MRMPLLSSCSGVTYSSLHVGLSLPSSRYTLLRSDADWWELRYVAGTPPDGSEHSDFTCAQEVGCSWFSCDSARKSLDWWITWPGAAGHGKTHATSPSGMQMPYQACCCCIHFALQSWPGLLQHMVQMLCFCSHNVACNACMMDIVKARCAIAAGMPDPASMTPKGRRPQPSRAAPRLAAAQAEKLLSWQAKSI